MGSWTDKARLCGYGGPMNNRHSTTTETLSINESH